MEISEIKDATIANFNFLKNASPRVQALSAVDLVMQVSAGTIWNIYLGYTALRCLAMAAEYPLASSERKIEIWKEAQAYSSMKVTGLVVSQVAFLALGLTTPASAVLVLAWGGVLASMSYFAHHRATLQENKLQWNNDPNLAGFRG